MRKKCVLGFVAFFLLVSSIAPAFAKNAYGDEFNGFYRYNILDESSNIRLEAGNPGEQFGTTVAQGDFNGDSKTDLLVGSPYYSYKGKVWLGRVSLFLGGKGISTGLRDLKKFPPDTVFRGVEENDQFGSAISAADLNGDGVSDIIVSAYSSQSVDSEKRPGRVYVIFGRKNGFPKVVDMRTEVPDILILGNKNESRLGISITSGDFNNDNYDDIAFASLGVAFSGFSNTGKVHVLLGRDFEDGKSHVFDLNERPLQWTLYGQETADYFGVTLTSGDINGDKLDDILVSSYFADNAKLQDVGKVFVFYGKPLNPSFWEKDITASFTPDFAFVGEEPKDWFSFATSTDDINNDSISDLLVSSFAFSKDEKIGKAYVIFGRRSFEQGALYKANLIADLTFKGEDTGNLLGASLTSGDFNGDLKRDILLAAPGAESSESSVPGRVYLFYGGFKSGTHVDLKDDFADVTIEGVNPDDWFGNAVSVLDFNADKISDIVISAMYNDQKNAANAGEVSIIFGKTRPLGTFVRISSDNPKVTRGDFVKHVIDVFGLENRRTKFIKKCESEFTFCLFNFSAESKFSGIKFESPMILYPDVFPAHRNYHYINIATMLGLMHGYMTEKNSPFKPESYITRIQALKVTLGASGLLKWKYKSDLAKELGGINEIEKQASAFPDVDPKKGHMWWYPRYVNYAFLTGIIDFDQAFRPDDPITQAELQKIIQNTLGLID